MKNDSNGLCRIIYAVFVIFLVVTVVLCTKNKENGLSEQADIPTTTTTTTTVEETEQTSFYKPDRPYVGMSEALINSTELGAAEYNVRHNYECISGNQYLANLYDFKQGGKVIFTARCVNGKVTEVWDREHETTAACRPTTRTTRTTKKRKDPYNAKDYYDVEDFYDDHYDDFFDYYDAEDYWRDHQ